MTAPAQEKKRGGRASRDKGNRLERAIVRVFQDHGVGAERVPLSGSTGGSYSGDLTVPILGRDLVVEAKARANGFARLYSWLEGRDALIIKADRRDALVVLPLRLAAEIPIRTQVKVFPLQEANQALNALKNDAIQGAAVLHID